MSVNYKCRLFLSDHIYTINAYLFCLHLNVVSIVTVSKTFIYLTLFESIDYLILKRQNKIVLIDTNRKVLCCYNILIIIYKYTTRRVSLTSLNIFYIINYIVESVTQYLHKYCKVRTEGTEKKLNANFHKIINYNIIFLQFLSHFVSSGGARQ